MSNTLSEYPYIESQGVDKRQLKLQHICLQLAALGHNCHMNIDRSYLSVADSLLRNYSQHRRLLADYRCPSDQRIQDFLNDYLQRNGVDSNINLPGETFSLLLPGLAREISLPYAGNRHYSSRSESRRGYCIIPGVIVAPRWVSSTSSKGGCLFPGTSVPSRSRRMPNCCRPR
jgi:hypothetical protein